MFFYRCQHTNSLWRNLKESIYNNTHKVVNCIILYTKAYIYKVDKSKGHVKIYGLLNSMRDTYENEKICIKDDLKIRAI